MADSIFVRLPRIARADGSLLPPETAIMLDGCTLTDVPDGVLGGGAITGYTKATPTGSAIVTTAAVQAAIAGQATAPASVTTTGDVVIGGKLTLGPDSLTPGTATTVGPATHALCTFALADNSGASARVDVVGRASSPVRIVSFSAVVVVSIESGSTRQVGAGTVLSVNELWLPVKAASLSWAAGVATITVGGPTVAIVGTADNGGGKVRVEVAGGLTNINVANVDISGVVGTTEINGTNLAPTWVDATHFDLLAISFVNPWVSGGTVVLHTPPTITWSSLAVAVVTPLP